MKDNNSLIKWFIILCTPVGWVWLIIKFFSSIFGRTLDTVDNIKNIPKEKEKKLHFEQIKKAPLLELDREGLSYRYENVMAQLKYTQEKADELAKIKYIYKFKYKRPIICNKEMEKEWYSNFNKCKTKHPEKYRRETISILELFTNEERKYIEPFIEEYQKEQEHRNKRLEEMKKRVKEKNAES